MYTHEISGGGKMIDKCFSGEMKNQIRKYCDFIDEISKNYDVLIFMARKAICFYNALVESKEIHISSNVVVASSRILQYECGYLKGKKVALIDDIIVKGKTLGEAEKAIKRIGVADYDIYCIASPNTYVNKRLKNCNGNPWELKSDEILVLGNAITNYITSNSCTYNIDYPVFCLKDDAKFERFLNDYISNKSCTIVPSGTFNNENEMYVELFDSHLLNEYVGSFLGSQLDRMSFIAKFRFYVDKREKKITAIPIVILPEMSKEQLMTLFSRLTGGTLDKLVGLDENYEEKYENILNVTQYILSFAVFRTNMNLDYVMDFCFDSDKMRYAFPNDYIETICKNIEQINKLPSLRQRVFVCNPITFSEVFQIFFDFLGNKHQEDTEHKAKYLFSEILNYCISTISNPDVDGILSVVFDFAIDTGLIVPTNKKTNYKLVRAYRLSEQYELTEKELDLVIYMYNRYMTWTGMDSMSAITTEKLAVLFFRDVIPNILYDKIVESGNSVKNAYGIAYAMYGPVVSESTEQLNVRKESFLSKRLSGEDRSEFKKLHQNKTNFTVKESERLFDDLPSRWTVEADEFVRRIATLQRLLEYYKLYNGNSLIKTFDKFLVLMSIGLSKTNQLLALASEVKMFFDMDPFTDMSGFCKSFDPIEPGIVSGAWKYLCFKREALEEIISKITVNNENESAKNLNYENRIKHLASLIARTEETRKKECATSDEAIEVFIKLGELIYGNSNKFTPDKVRGVLKQSKSKDDFYKRLNAYYDKIISDLKFLKLEQYDLKANIDTDIIKCNPKVELERTTYGTNKNEDVIQKYDCIMDEMGIFLYELMVCWNFILKNRCYAEKPKNADYNKSYINQISEVLSQNSRFEEIVARYDSCDKEFIYARISELHFQAEVLLNKVSELIKAESVVFNECNKFWVIRRDDGNAIEDNKILELKDQEIKLTKFWEIGDDKSIAIIRKSSKNDNAVENFIMNKDMEYTIINYNCNETWDSILETKTNCFSNGVKCLIEDLLKDFYCSTISVTERS